MTATYLTCTDNSIFGAKKPVVVYGIWTSDTTSERVPIYFSIWGPEVVYKTVYRNNPETGKKEKKDYVRQALLSESIVISQEDFNKYFTKN